MRKLFFGLMLGPTVGLLAGDTLLLQNGQTLSGVFLGGDSRTLRFETGDRIQTYNVGDVKRIEFGDVGAVPASGLTNTNSLSGSQATASTIPAGTQIEVRLIDAIDSKKDSVGQTYRASLARPLLSGGQILAPAGSDVTLALVDKNSSGKITGKTSLELELKNLRIEGETYDAASSSVSRASGSRGTKSAEVIGGAATLGTLIGAIAGGGKGAAIGALSGGGAGAATQVLTSGERVRIPSETRLTFTLNQPITIKAVR